MIGPLMFSLRLRVNENNINSNETTQMKEYSLKLIKNVYI